MLIEFSRDVDNCRTNWMQKSALPDGISEEDLQAYLARRLECDLGYPRYEDELNNTFNDAASSPDSRGLYNRMTGLAGGLGLGLLLDIAYPRRRRKNKFLRMIPATGLCAFLGRISGGMSEAYNRVQAGNEAVKTRVLNDYICDPSRTEVSEPTHALPPPQDENH